MKPIILLLLTACSLCVKGQVKYDTVPCIMLVSDTVAHCGYVSVDGNGHQNNNACIYNYQSLWKRGYEVRQVDSAWEDTNHTALAYSQMEWVEYYSHHAYLDVDKHPLTLFVWQVKQL